jgi:hypothetical protein
MRGKPRALFCFLPYDLTNPVGESLMINRKLPVFFCHASQANKKIGCHSDIRFFVHFPNLPLSSSTTLSSNFLKSGPG